MFFISLGDISTGIPNFLPGIFKRILDGAKGELFIEPGVCLPAWLNCIQKCVLFLVEISVHFFSIFFWSLKFFSSKIILPAPSMLNRSTITFPEISNPHPPSDHLLYKLKCFSLTWLFESAILSVIADLHILFDILEPQGRVKDESIFGELFNTLILFCQIQIA